MAKTKSKRTKKSKTTTTTKTAAKRRLPKRLSQIFYCYVEPINGRHAREYGKKHFGSFSAYVDALVSADRKEKFVSVPISVSKLKKETIGKKASKKSSKPTGTKKVKKRTFKKSKVSSTAHTAPSVTPAETTAPAEQQAA